MKRGGKPLTVWMLILLIGFLSVSGFVGAFGLLKDTSGAEIGFPPDMIKKLPFPDYLIPGLFLLLIYGCGGMLTVFGLIKRPVWPWARLVRHSRKQLPIWSLALWLGIIVMIWIIVQVGLLGPPIAALQIAYFSLGAASLTVSLLPAVRSYYSMTTF